MFSSTPIEPPRETAGFTLIEVVVTLAVMAVILLSIGSLVSNSVRGTRSLESHLALVQVARMIEAELPDYNSLQLGTISGETNGQAWLVDVEPFPTDTQSQSRSQWMPMRVSIQVQTRDGSNLTVSTIRLGRRQ